MDGTYFVFVEKEVLAPMLFVGLQNPLIGNQLHCGVYTVVCV